MNSNENKLMGFLIQMLGFVLVFNGLKNSYYFKLETSHIVDGWLVSGFNPILVVGFFAMFVIGLFVIAYGILLFKKEAETLEVNQ